MVAPAIGFNVAPNKNQANGPATLEFGDIVSHYGNCWNSAVNAFIAPITGLYSFHLSIMNYNDKKTAFVKLMHEDKEIQVAYAHGHGDHHTSTASAVVKVNKGEHVYARLMHGTVHSSSTHHWSSFVGFLVQKM